ncbi:terminase [Fusobacterium necrophorum]|uniref:terminase n=1 Tax=Fusobacterium necrophorum TaxID=859 RepID=UPI003F9EC8C5
MAYDMNLIRLEAKKELARRDFWSYCNFFSPNFYTEKKAYLTDLCNRLQTFIESDKKVLVVNMPPRFREVENGY